MEILTISLQMRPSLNSDRFVPMDTHDMPDFGRSIFFLSFLLSFFLQVSQSDQFCGNDGTRRTPLYRSVPVKTNQFHALAWPFLQVKRDEPRRAEAKRDEAHAHAARH